jgi:hypothetical protein
MAKKPYNYLTDPKLLKNFEFHLYDVVCKHCRRCSSGDHDYTKIPHKPKCVMKPNEYAMAMYQMSKGRTVVEEPEKK